MRITGGSLSGRRVVCPPGTIRPAMDRMRESLFSTLGDLTALSFLDLFSGSGLVALEAYSRGARPVLLVEKDPGKRRVILENLAGLDPAPRLLVQPVERFIARNRTPYELVYLDPPFSYRFKDDLLRRLTRSRTVARETRILIHAPSAEVLAQRYGDFVLEQRREYGGSFLWFYRADHGPDTEPAT